MTVASTTSRVSYSTNGSTTLFQFPYYFLDQTDLVVILKNTSTGVETPLTLTTNYTVTGAGVQAGGSITTLVTYPTGSTISIYRDPSIVQELDLVENDSLPAESLEMELDKLTMIAQRHDDLLTRAVTLSEGTPAGSFDPTLPETLEPETVVQVNAAGDGFEQGPSSADISAAATNAAAAAASAATAAAAAATVTSAFYRDVVYKTSADSPVTIASGDNGKLYSFDTSGGAISVTLPQLSSITPPFNWAAILKTAGNNLTINRAGSDTIAGATSKVISAAGVGCQIVGDTDAAPDDWSVLDFGSVADGATTLAKLASQVSFPEEKFNYSLTGTVAANALTIALKSAAGTNPSATDPVKISFRSSTLGTGTSTVVSQTGSLSTVISSGSTAGHLSGVDDFLYVYAINNAGSMELAWSSTRFNEGQLWSTTAEGGAGAADAFEKLYSTTARSNVAIRLLGRMKSNQATAGTWASAPTEIALPPFDLRMPCFTGYMPNGTFFTANGTAFADMTPTGANTLTTRLRIGMNVTAAASNLPGLIITPPSVDAVYEVGVLCNTFNTGAGGSPTAGAIRLYDGTNEIAAVDQIAASQQSTFISGFWRPGTTSATTIKLQMAAPSSATNSSIGVQTSLVPVLDWSIRQII